MMVSKSNLRLATSIEKCNVTGKKSKGESFFIRKVKTIQRKVYKHLQNSERKGDCCYAGK